MYLVSSGVSLTSTFDPTVEWELTLLCQLYATVMELVDLAHSKCVAERRAGSSPAGGTRGDPFGMGVTRYFTSGRALGVHPSAFSFLWRLV